VLVRLPFAGVLLCCLAAAQTSDPLLRAMQDELHRSRDLKVLSLEAPYFVEYAIEDGDSFSVSATLGGMISLRHDRFRVPEINVRVGDYNFDNTDYVGSGFHFSSHYDIDHFPIDNDYLVLRRFLWLATDSAYKNAVEAISRKRAALRDISNPHPLHDFAKAGPVTKIEELRHTRLDEDAWTRRVRSLSAIFDQYPEVTASRVDLSANQGARYYVNSEGSAVRIPEQLIILQARAEAQAPDGMIVRDRALYQSLDFNRMPPEADLRRDITALAQHVTELAGAPKADDYTGPVLFDGMAAAQIFAEVLGRNLALRRRPVMEPGHSAFIPMSELEGRVGVRILPEYFDVVDDPTQKEWQGRPLLGHYEIDREAVPARPLVLVEKGVLKTYLMTRQPMPGLEGSNGRARMTGSFGANTAGISNLFVRATQTTPVADLKKKLLEMIASRHKPYGVIVREMDFPSSASLDEVRRMLSNAAQSEGYPVSRPLLIYRVYPGGREQLVRGWRFRDFNTRSLKDIVAAGDDNNMFEFLNNPAPFALIGAYNYVAESCVIAPSVLIDDMDLHAVEDQSPRLPIVPPPPLTASRK
jgi:PmbA/TldA metallopeptidase C-terminal domain